MPQIPTFDTNVPVPVPQGPPRADPQAFGQQSAALARAGAEVSGVAQQFADRYAEARRQSQAAAIVADSMRQINDQADLLSKVPDSQAAYSQAGKAFDAITKSAVASNTDPLVQGYVNDRLTQYGIIKQEATKHAAFGVEASQHVADIQGKQLPQFTQTIAGSNDPHERAFTIDQLDQSLAGSAASGWISPEQALLMRSGALKSAIETRAASDPIGAQALATDVKNRLTAGDGARVEELLRSVVPRKQAEDRMQEVAAGPQSAGVTAVRDGMMKRGYSFADATAFAANASAESSGDTGAVNPDGTSRGLFQWTGPRRQAFIDKYGVEPDKGTLDQQLDFADAELKGPEAAAWQKIKAANSIADKSAAVSTFYERPSDTAGEERRRAKIADYLANGDQPDIQTQLQQYREKVQDLPVWAQEHGEAMLMRRYNDQQRMQAGARSELEHQANNLEAAYLQGMTQEEPPESDIRRLLPPAKAEAVLERLTIARQAGDLFSGVQFASPQQEHDAASMLATPGSLADGRLVVRNHQVVPPADGSVEPTAETADQVQLRTKVANKYQELLTQKHAAIMADPAGYAAQQPDVLATLKAADQNDPQATQAARQKLLDAQAQLGVPESQQHLLTNGEVAAWSQRFNNGDPGQRDIRGEITQLQQQYGPLWPKAFQDLVTVGKLDPAWNVVASMSAPEQQGAASELVRALQAEAKPGQAEMLAKAVPQADRTIIDKNLATDLAPMRQTLMLPGGSTNMALYGALESAVRTLAYSNAIKGTVSSGSLNSAPGGETALQSAIDAVVGQKYDLDGTLRTPKGLMKQAQALTWKVQSAITPDDIGPSTPPAGLTDEQNRQLIATAAVRDGKWFANPADDGAVLMAPLRQGGYVPVIRKDGTPYEVKWTDAAKAPPLEPTLGGEDQRQGLNVPGWRPNWQIGPNLHTMANRLGGGAASNPPTVQ